MAEEPLTILILHGKIPSGTFPLSEIAHEGAVVTDATRYRANKPQVIFEMFEDEIVLINLESGNYFSLNKVGAGIWSDIERGLSADEIRDRLAARYAGDPSQMAESLSRLIADLAKEGLIVPRASTDPAAIPADEAPSTGAKPAFEAPILQMYNDMQELLLLDPIHEVDESGWPNVKTDDA